MAAVVVIADTKEGLDAAFDAVFAPFGGVEKVIPAGSTVFVKPNGVFFFANSYTDPVVVDALLAYLGEHGYERRVLMENSSAGVSTRLVFNAVGYTDIARRHGADIVYLDEGPTDFVTLDGEESPIRVSRRLYDTFIDPNRAPGNFYLTLPKLKTHSMTTVTLGVKNQQGFPVDEDRMGFHSHKTLHPRLARLYKLLQPDFCIIEGITATYHGNVPPAALQAESSARLDVLIGGRDTLAVDVIGSRVLGYSLSEVEHLRLAAEWGLGEGEIKRIEVIGDLDRFTTRYPYEIHRRFIDGIRIVQGRERACVEGCKGNTECVLEILGNDYDGKGGFSVVFGKGFEDGDLVDLPGDILVVGDCAIEERGDELKRRYADRRVIQVGSHNDLRGIISGVAKLMGVRPMKVIPLSPLRAGWTLAQARLHGLNSRITPMFR